MCDFLLSPTLSREHQLPWLSQIPHFISFTRRGPWAHLCSPWHRASLDILCRQKLPLHSTHSFIALISKFFVLVVSYILSRFLVGFSFYFIFPRWEGKACPYCSTFDWSDSLLAFMSKSRTPHGASVDNPALIKLLYSQQLSLSWHCLIFLFS